ncbi:MAG: DUF3703 domain-containing protein [Nevskiales bacterium]
MPDQDRLKQARDKLRAGQVQAAIDLLDDLHVQAHETALLHMRTHWALASAHRQAGHYRRAAFELAAIPFAGPASLLHRYFGVARKNL